jgi:hypothetical protein
VAWFTETCFLFCSEIFLSQIHADARSFVAWSLRPFCFISIIFFCRSVQ